MTKVEDLISMNIGFCNIKIASNQGYQERIKNVVKKFVEKFTSFVHITLTKFLSVRVRGLQPRKSYDLDNCH